MKCEYCENEVPTGVSRCPSCGAAVNSPSILLHEPDSARPRQSHESQKVAQTAYFGDGVVRRLKNKWVFILLGIFLGEFGIHNFYTGYIGRGVVKLMITVVSFGWLFWISWIWAIVEICSVRIDAKGCPFGSDTI